MSELTQGSRLGIFEVGELRGEGGMGKVYRARDTKLDRDVALRPSPPSTHHASVGHGGRNRRR